MISNLENITPVSLVAYVCYYDTELNLELSIVIIAAMKRPASALTHLKLTFFTMIRKGFYDCLLVFEPISSYRLKKNSPNLS